MAKRTGPTNRELKDLIDLLIKKTENKIWKRVTKELSKPTRIRPKANLSKIDKHSKDKETILVPGTVLGTGELTKNITIAAYKFSKAAQEKINKAKSKSITIEELLKNNPKGEKIRIIG